MSDDLRMTMSVAEASPGLKSRQTRAMTVQLRLRRNRSAEPVVEGDCTNGNVTVCILADPAGLRERLPNDPAVYVSECPFIAARCRGRVWRPRRRGDEYWPVQASQWMLPSGPHDAMPDVEVAWSCKLCSICSGPTRDPADKSGRYKRHRCREKSRGPDRTRPRRRMTK